MKKTVKLLSDILNLQTDRDTDIRKGTGDCVLVPQNTREKYKICGLTSLHTDIQQRKEGRYHVKYDLESTLLIRVCLETLKRYLQSITTRVELFWQNAAIFPV